MNNDNPVEVKFKKQKRGLKWEWHFKYEEDDVIFQWIFQSFSIKPDKENETKIIEISDGLKAFAKEMLKKKNDL